ncbi:MAG: Ig-like domain-containing protein, partial [Candidatus Omnitrophica bacterium]|nr:Ig-like domain-containing protein [Candidatus Omnitrophota bacterium]
GIVELEWGEAADKDNNIDIYQLYRDLSEIKEEYLQDIMRGRPSRFVPFATVPKSKAVNGMFRYSDVGLPNGTIYYYGVTALDLDKNEGKASNTIGVKVFGVDIVPPFVERVSHDAVGKPLKAGKVLLVTSTGESGNNVTFDLVKWPENSVVMTSRGPVENRPMQVASQPGLYFGFETITADYPNNVSILPRVYYTDPAGNGAPMLGDTTLPITVDTIPPERISKINGVIEDYAVKLSWEDVNEKIAGYRVYRSGAAINESALDTNNIISGSKLIKKEKKDAEGFLHFTDYNPIPRETYFYAAASVDEAGNESISGNLEFAIPDVTGPPAIFNVTENTVGAPKKAGSNITITVRGDLGKRYEIKSNVYETKAYFSIKKEDSTIVEKTRINEVLIGDRHTGTYEGTYTVKSSDEVKDAQLTGYLVEPFGNYESSFLCTTYVTLVGTSTDTTAPLIQDISVAVDYTNQEGKIPVLTNEQKQYLVSNNEIKISLRGEAGGIAFFDIGTMRRNIRMKEDPANPGTYTGNYKIMQGDRMNPLKVTGYLVDAAGNMSSLAQSTSYKIDTIIIINMDRTREEISTNEYDPIEARISNLTAILRDRHNNALKNREVEFRLVGGYGSMNPLIGVTDTEGKVKSTYTAGYVVETGYIAAEDRSTGYAGVTYVTTSKTGTVNILLDALTPPPGQRTSNGVAYISLRAKPLRIEADGKSVSVISAFVGYIGDDQIINDPYSEDYEPDSNKIARDIPIKNIEVRFLIRDYVEDYKRPEYYGLPKAEELDLKRGKIEALQPFTDQNGEAKAVYTSGTKSGLTIIQAIAATAPGGPVGETIGVVLIAGGVRYLLIEAKPIGTPQNPINSQWGAVIGSAQNSKIKADGAARAQIRVTLLDSYENPVPDIKVNYTSDNGQVLEDGNGLTDKDGMSLAVYTAPRLDNGGIGHVSAKVTSANPLEEGLVNFNLGNRKNIEGKFTEANKNYTNAAKAFEAVAAGYPYEHLIYPLASKKWTPEEQERSYPDMIWNDDMLYVMGYTYELLENYDKAVTHYNELIDFYFGGSWADNGSYRKGQVYEEQAELEQDESVRKDYIDKALDTYEKLLEKFDTSNLADNAVFQMGRIYEQKEFYPKAIETYKRLVRDYPNSDLVNYSWYSIGQCYEQLGQKDEAINAYQRVLGAF